MSQLNSFLCRLTFALLFFLVATTNSNAESVTIPKDTRIHILMLTDIDSNTCESGDNFSAEISEDVFVDNKMVLPIGTKIYGVVIRHEPWNSNRGNSIYLHFSSIKTLSGTSTSLPAKLVARGSLVTFKRGEQLVTIDAAFFFQGFMVGNFSPEESKRIEAARNATYNLLLAKKGKHIDIKVGDVTRIELQKDLLLN